MAATRAYYIVYAALPDGTVVPAADLGLETDQRGRHVASGLRYRGDWLRHPERFALNPVHAPLVSGEIEWQTREIPALIDEVYPGRWERAVIARMWQRSGQHGDPSDLHAILSATRDTFRVGAMEVRPADAPPPSLGESTDVAELEALAQAAEELVADEDPELEALKRLQAGSSVGGARPKVTVHDSNDYYLAKFTRDDDSFNHARVEHVCLELARRAGIPAPASRIVKAGRFDALLVSRFDVAPEGGRYHLVSANALLKDAETQGDRPVATYEDLVRMIRYHSEQPTEDLRQLFAQMLLNEAINNLDDHLRNFSFRQGPGGFHLSPAYDLVPDQGRGSYPNLGFNFQPSRPRPERSVVRQAAASFNVPPREAEQVMDRLEEAFQSLQEILEEAEVSEVDKRLLSRVIQPPKA